MVALLAVVYLQIRTPQPQYNDISFQIARDDRQLVKLTGKVLTEPRLSDRNSLKFLVQAETLNNEEQVSGKLYSTLPLLQGTGIYSGQELTLTGYLYLPQPASSPYGFDFQKYLARQGVFAGVRGTEASFDPVEPQWSWSRLRQKIVRTHLKGLGSPRGQLVSSMVLGRRAVDLPRDIRDSFIVSGLAHVLAASGFHVSLLLGIILKLTERVAAKPRLAIGLGALSIYLGLTGMQASVMRACLMGAGVLLALTMNTKVKPLGSLLVAAVVILLFDPGTIGDLGFKLSFLATFGLIVTLPQLQNKLEWLPSTIATLVAIPLAASVWVLPLLCYEFNTLATYSLLVNIICTPLIILVSLGGMISAIAGLAIPALGSAIASILFYPTTLLMAITQFFSALPGSNWSVGRIPLVILLAIYALFILIWLSQWWQKRWWLGLILPIAIFMTLAINNSFQLQIAVLPNPQSPIVIIRDRDRVILFNSGKEDRAKYTVLPFLAQQGINHINYGIAIDSSSNSTAAWKTIDSRARVSSIYKTVSSSHLFDFKTESRPLSKTVTTKSIRLNLDELGIVSIQTADNTWLILSQSAKLEPDFLVQYLQQHNLGSQHPIVVWSGDIDPNCLEILKPQIAIAYNDKISSEIKKIFQQKQIEFYNTSIAGTIRWTPKQGFVPDWEKAERNNNF